MTWQLASVVVLSVALAIGFGWYERSRPPARVLALVAALAALAAIGRVAFAAFPNVKPTTDIVLFSGYALGGPPGQDATEAPPTALHAGHRSPGGSHSEPP